MVEDAVVDTVDDAGSVVVDGDDEDENSYRLNFQDPPHPPDKPPEGQGESQPVEGMFFDRASAT